MRARFMLENPDKMEATIKMTMSVGDWVILREQLEHKWPSSDLSRAISDVVVQARKVFHSAEQES